MAYEINISLNGNHLFATNERSITNSISFEEVLKILQAKFTEADGYQLSASYNPNVSYRLDVGEEISKQINEIYKN